MSEKTTSNLSIIPDPFVAPDEYKDIPTSEILKPELTLDQLGVIQEELIEWSDDIITPKKDLELEITRRIPNLINPDFTVIIDKKEFKCHILVLQSYSKVFDTHLTSRKIQLSSENCTPAAFKFIYKWMITSDPSSYEGLNCENVIDIYLASKYLEINDLTKQCWWVIDQINVYTEYRAYLLYIEAKKKFLPEVMQIMLPRIKKFFLILVATEDWLHLDLEHVQNFLKSNYVCINCEMDIFMSGVRWLNHDWGNRKQHKIDVMKCVRFAHIPEWQLVDIKQNAENSEFRAFIDDPSICEMIDDGLSYVIMKENCVEAEQIKYWKKELALKQPVARNWSKNTHKYVTYSDFLFYLDAHRKKAMMTKSDGSDRSAATLSAAGSSNTIDGYLANLSAAGSSNMIDGCLANLFSEQP